MNRALMAASLVDRVQVTLFPALTGQTGLAQIFEGAAEGSLHMRRWRHPHIVIMHVIFVKLIMACSGGGGRRWRRWCPGARRSGPR